MTKGNHHHPHREATPAAANIGKNNSGCLVVFLIIIAFVLGRCTAPTTPSNSDPQLLTTAVSSSSESSASPSTYRQKKHLVRAESAASSALSIQAPQTETVPAYTPVPSADETDNGYYTNRDGNVVRSPHKEVNGCAASGASARCRDGTCSFSQHRSGTCSRHGGVAEWM